MTNYSFFVVLIVRATIAVAAKQWLSRHGFGDGATRALIRKTDANTATPIAWGMELLCTPGERTVLARKAEGLGSNAEIFWSTNRREARQLALQFIDSKGLKLKPQPAAQ